MRDLRPPRLSDERGVALALAVFALVVIGALVAGVFLSGQLEQRSGTNAVSSAKAFQAAEAGLAQVIDTWSSTTYNGMATYPATNATVTDASATEVVSGSGAWYQASVTRLNGGLFFVKVHGEQRSGTTVLASRDVGAFVRLFKTSFSATSALTAKGNVVVKGTSNIVGNNTKAWSDCPDVSDALPAIRTTGTVSTSGHPTISGAGTPPYQENQSIPDSTFMRPFNDMKPLANKVIPEATTILSPQPIAAGTPATCTSALVTNWGEPDRGSGTVPACADYFPVIYHKGDLKLTTGRGQGILLVEGNLELAGNFEFNGIIITTGNFDASNGTNTVNGAVLSQNATLQVIDLAGNPTVNYSSCAVTRALTASASVRQLGERSWVQLVN